MKPLISVHNLRKTFSGRASHSLEVLKGVDLEVCEGELTVILGRSGCGKSTLLRCLNGLEPFDSGRITVCDTALERPSNGNRGFHADATRLRSHCGMVFQSFNLFPHLTLLENVSKALVVVKGKTQKEADSIALPLIEKVGLSNHLKHYPSQLSGGQQQRAAIARALAMSPKVMLYDEPTSALDPWLVDEVFQVMKKLDAERLTQIVVTHEVRFAKDYADKVVFIEDGNVVEVGTPEQLFSSPRDERTRQYLGRFT